MPLEIRENEITNISADAVVNPTDHFLSGFSSIDSKIHKAAGPALKDECDKTYYLNSGLAVLTEAYGLASYKYIIHTCGPDYTNGSRKEELILESCYEECLKLAKEKQLGSIVIPVYDSGTFGFPVGQAIRIATDVISDFLSQNEMRVFLLVDNRKFVDDRNVLYKDINNYLESETQKASSDSTSKPKHKRKPKSSNQSIIDTAAKGIEKIKDFAFLYPEEDEQSELSEELFESAPYIKEESRPHYYQEPSGFPRFVPDESFSECLIRMIDNKGMNDPQVYKKANIDRKHFNHIKNTKDYKPKKETVVALAIGMELDMSDTNILLEKAGFVLSRSSKFDLIIRYCIEHRIYDIYRINEILFAEDQKTLGC